MSAGRRDLFAQHSNDAEFIARFDKLMDDVAKGRTPLKVAAQALNVHPRTLERAIEKRKKQRAAVATYDRVEKWSLMPEAQNFDQWITGRFSKNEITQSNGKTLITRVQTLWIEVWNRKNLALLTKEDINAAILWIRANKPLSVFPWIVALRALIRSGVGNHGWLSELLETRGTKNPPRIPPELRTKETFVTVMPRLFTALLDMRASQEVTADEFEEMDVIVTAKNTTGIRTGHYGTKRELWGTVINSTASGNATNLLVNFESGRPRVLHWTIFAKKSETWELPRDALSTYDSLGLLERLETFIAKRGLKTGDRLITMQMKRARDILTRMCEKAGLTHYTLHDLRKIAATRSILAGVHLETVADMGVGWKDIDTLKEFYVTIRGVHADEGYAAVKAYLGNGGRETRATDNSAGRPSSDQVLPIVAGSNGDSDRGVERSDTAGD